MPRRCLRQVPPGPGVPSGGFTEDALRGAGCFAVAGEISRLLGALEDTKPSPARG